MPSYRAFRQIKIRHIFIMQFGGYFVKFYSRQIFRPYGIFLLKYIKHNNDVYKYNYIICITDADQMFQKGCCILNSYVTIYINLMGRSRLSIIIDSGSYIYAGV